MRREGGAGDGQGGEGEGKTGAEELATRIWMKANTRPCPKCSNPIEKNDGCNHMTCRNRVCRHDFCWICMGPWAQHGNKSGGYYQCNRYEGPDAKDHKGSHAETKRRADAASKFVFFFERFAAHSDSLRLEAPMLVCQRIMC